MILIGKIIGTHGIKGYLKIKPYTDFLDRFDKNKILKIKLDNSLFEFLIEDSFVHKDFVCAKLESVDSINDAQKLVSREIFILDDDLRKLDEDEYYVHDLVGLEVKGQDGESIGKIVDVIRLVSNDVFEIELVNNKKVFYPFLKDFVEEINLKEGYIRIKNYEGFFDSNDAI